MTGAPGPTALSTAIVWGTTVVALRHLAPGESLEIGDGPPALAPRPLGAEMPGCPIRSGARGWELDARGATGGLASIGGVELDPSELPQDGREILLSANDWGLVEFGSIAVFFQLSRAAPPLSSRRRADWGLLWAFLFSATATLGGLALLRGITSPSEVERPFELTPRPELFRLFHVSARPSGLAGQGGKNPSRPQPEPAGPRKPAFGPQSRGTDDAARREPAVGSIGDLLGAEAGDQLRRALAAIPSTPGGTGQPSTRAMGVVQQAGDRGMEPAESPHQGLGTDEINRVMTARMPLFRSCYDAARAYDPKLKGAVSVSFSVLPSGAVAVSTLAASSLKHKGVENCILQHFRGLAFPPSEGRTNASYAFTFSPEYKP